MLPFVNMSPDKKQECFADGISEELLNLLAKVPGRIATTKTAVRRHQADDREAPIAAIAG